MEKKIKITCLLLEGGRIEREEGQDWERPDLCGGGAPLATDATRVVLCDIRGYFCARVICQPLARRGWADRPVKPLLL
ncbi:hypothetical protein CDAR_18381 [Caerostris darwini]|uniref:Uncharacterized protein n=1 Tax=Caerostris darwini TaxID=1538125 RepID=A0AAV4V9S6_9ARAC|nr:hypothetical protein CDAR_18381 [Caerostris darwini]